MTDHLTDAQSLQDRLRFKWADNGAGYNTEYTKDLQEAADLIDEQAKSLLDAMAELDQLRATEPPHCPTCECGHAPVAPIASVIVGEDDSLHITMYAPGLPPGQHDLFPVPMPPCSAKPPIEPFVVKHYTSDERPTIKGNGFDGFEVGETREEAQHFVDWVNERLGFPCSASGSP